MFHQPCVYKHVEPLVDAFDNVTVHRPAVVPKSEWNFPERLTGEKPFIQRDVEQIRGDGTTEERLQRTDGWMKERMKGQDQERVFTAVSTRAASPGLLEHP